MRWVRRWFTAHLTPRRWNRNPYQMWMITAMMWVSINQINFLPVTGAVADLARQSQLWLACCNLLGGVITMAGLHLRDRDLGHWIELCGSFALVGSMGLYVWLVMTVDDFSPAVSFGLGLGQAFVLASVHRGVLIVVEKVRIEIRYRRREELHRIRLKRSLEAIGITEEDLLP